MSTATALANIDEVVAAIKAAVEAAFATANGGNPIKLFDQPPAKQGLPYMVWGLGITSERRNVYKGNGTIEIYTDYNGSLKFWEYASMLAATLDRRSFNQVAGVAATTRITGSQPDEPDSRNRQGTVRFTIHLHT